MVSGLGCMGVAMGAAAAAAAPSSSGRQRSDRSVRRRWLLSLLFSFAQSEVEETLERIKAHKGVEGVIIGERRGGGEGKEGRDGWTRGGAAGRCSSVPPRLGHGGHRPSRCCAAATDDDHAMRYRGGQALTHRPALLLLSAAALCCSLLSLCCSQCRRHPDSAREGHG